MEVSSILRGMTRDGSARILVINSRKIVDDAIRVHSCAPSAAAALGRALTAVSMIGCMSGEKEDTVTLGFNGDGQGGRIIVVGNYYGDVKGYIESPAADPPKKSNGKLDVSAVVGHGIMYIARDLAGKESQTGTVEIKSGEIAEDIANYFSESEQVPTLCSLGVLVDRDYTCRAAGGVLIQLLPFADENTISILERNASELTNISRLFERGASLKEVADIAMRDIPYDLFDEIEVSYHCDCSAERMKKGIRSLGREKVLELLDEEEAEGKPRSLTAECRFCNRSYTFTEKELI